MEPHPFVARARRSGDTILAEELRRLRRSQRDLEEVDAVISLEQSYGHANPWIRWARPLAGLAVAVLVFIVGLVLASRVRRPETTRSYQVPEPATPFSVLELLRDIERNNGLNEQRRGELAESISRLERHYFANENGEEPDLSAIARQWVERAS